MMNIYKNLAVFAGGVLFGSAGIKLLSSKDAKKVYTVNCVQENAADILASAQDINEARAAQEEAAAVADTAEEEAAAE